VVHVLEQIARDHVAPLAKVYGLARRGRSFYLTNDRDDAVALHLRGNRLLHIGEGTATFRIAGSITNPEFDRLSYMGPAAYARGAAMSPTPPPKAFGFVEMSALVPPLEFSHVKVYYDRFLQGAMHPLEPTRPYPRPDEASVRMAPDWCYDPTVHDIDEFGRMIVRTLQKKNYLNTLLTLLDREVLLSELRLPHRDSILQRTGWMAFIVGAQELDPPAFTELLNTREDMNPDLRARFAALNREWHSDVLDGER